jgi:DNA-directed RNA polymerase specialized sigma24 family protein
MLMTTDTLLVYRAAHGDREAFDAVYDASFACAYAFSLRCSADRAAAEALTEQILERAFRDLAQYAGDVPFAAWLFHLAKQVTRDAYAPPRAPVATGQRSRR